MFCSYPLANAEKSFRSHVDVPSTSALILGAGASAEAGCPLVRGFIDRARGQRQKKSFEGKEARDVGKALQFYEKLQRQLLITEEDIENIENLLSLADLSAFLSDDEDVDLPQSLRRFIDAVINKSVRLPGPTSNAWISSSSAAFQYKLLAQGLAERGQRTAVLTLNYDCTLEYCLSCMGVPFRYSQNQGEGVLILKLHGSTNWTRCASPLCHGHDEVQFAPIEFKSTGGIAEGHLIRPQTSCSKCGAEAVPLIVPPTWRKDLNAPVLSTVWKAAAEKLEGAESLVAVGYSLPEADSHVRQLLHVGLKGGKLKQALAVVGPDSAAAARWAAIFRPSWGNARMDIREADMVRTIRNVILPALGAPLQAHPIQEEIWCLPPVPIGWAANASRYEKLKGEYEQEASRKGWAPFESAALRNVIHRWREDPGYVGQSQSECEILTFATRRGLLYFGGDSVLPSHAGFVL